MATEKIGELTILFDTSHSVRADTARHTDGEFGKLNIFRGRQIRSTQLKYKLGGY